MPNTAHALPPGELLETDCIHRCTGPRSEGPLSGTASTDLRIISPLPSNRCAPWGNSTATATELPQAAAVQVANGAIRGPASGLPRTQAEAGIRHQSSRNHLYQAEVRISRRSSRSHRSRERVQPSRPRTESRQRPRWRQELAQRRPDSSAAPYVRLAPAPPLVRLGSLCAQGSVSPYTSSVPS